MESHGVWMNATSRVHKHFYKSSSHLAILGATVPASLARVVWLPGLVHFQCERCKIRNMPLVRTKGA